MCTVISVTIALPGIPSLVFYIHVWFVVLDSGMSISLIWAPRLEARTFLLCFLWRSWCYYVQLEVDFFSPNFSHQTSRHLAWAWQFGILSSQWKEKMLLRGHFNPFREIDIRQVGPCSLPYLLSTCSWVWMTNLDKVTTFW